MKIIQERLERLSNLSLKKGSHEPPNGEFEACAMEMVSWLAGEPWSDEPQCVCPVIGSFMVAWNDRLPTDEDRDRLLKPLLLKVIGTRSTDAVSERRSYMALDWLIRVHTPAWLDLTESLKPHAKALRDLDEIADMAGAAAAGEVVRAARDAARDAAWDAAGAAAWAAAWDAAGAAAWAAAGAAARDAAWAAAGAAARAALKPTTEFLQESASDLVARMSSVGDTIRIVEVQP